MKRNDVKAVITVAGSDSSGGAGIQADIKTFEEFDEIGLSVITAITCQNPQKIYSILPIPPKIIQDQLTALFDYYQIEYVKTGMLYSKEIMEILLKFKQEKKFKLIIDPIFKSSSGSVLMKPEAKEFLVKELIPNALLITPNLLEAEELVNGKITDFTSQVQAARNLKKLGSEAVLVKGGHLNQDPFNDVLIIGEEMHGFQKQKLEISYHGSGCRLSAAITANLNKGFSIEEAVHISEKYVERLFEAKKI